MRKEAELKDWKKLMELSDRVYAKKPWNLFTDMQLIGFTTMNREIYANILGYNGNTFGIVFYDGRAGLNDYLMILAKDNVGLSDAYIMQSQNALVLYWGSEDEIPDYEMYIRRQLGKDYTKPEGVPYFLSLKAGYFPYQPDSDEVHTLIRCLTRISEALDMYETQGRPDFDLDHMYYYFGANASAVGTIFPLPMKDFESEVMDATPEPVRHYLKEATPIQDDWLVDLHYIARPMEHPEFDRPINPLIMIIQSQLTGQILHFDMILPDENINQFLIEHCADTMKDFGIPDAIQVRGHMFATMVESLCEAMGINLDIIEDFSELDDLYAEMFAAIDAQDEQEEPLRS